MIALLSSLLGFGSAFIPEVLKLLQDRRDKAHELALIKLQGDILDKQADRDLEKTLISATGAQAVAVQESYQADIKATVEAGYGWVSALAASVRPVLTYGFFLLYVGVKVAQFHLLMDPILPWASGVTFAEAIVLMWNGEDTAIFSAIVCFWFGDRIRRNR